MKHPPPLRGASAGEVGDLRIRSGTGTDLPIEDADREASNGAESSQDEDIRGLEDVQGQEDTQALEDTQRQEDIQSPEDTEDLSSGVDQVTATDYNTHEIPRITINELRIDENTSAAVEVTLGGEDAKVESGAGSGEQNPESGSVTNSGGVHTEDVAVATAPEDGSDSDSGSAPLTPDTIPASPTATLSSQSSLEDISDAYKLDSSTVSPVPEQSDCFTPSVESDADDKSASSIIDNSPLISSPESKGSLFSSGYDDSSSISKGSESYSEKDDLSSIGKGSESPSTKSVSTHSRPNSRFDASWATDGSDQSSGLSMTNGSPDLQSEGSSMANGSPDLPSGGSSMVNGGPSQSSSSPREAASEAGSIHHVGDIVPLEEQSGRLQRWTESFVRRLPFLPNRPLPATAASEPPEADAVSITVSEMPPSYTAALNHSTSSLYAMSETAATPEPSTSPFEQPETPFSPYTDDSMSDKKSLSEHSETMSISSLKSTSDTKASDGKGKSRETDKTTLRQRVLTKSDRLRVPFARSESSRTAASRKSDDTDSSSSRIRPRDHLRRSNTTSSNRSQRSETSSLSNVSVSDASVSEMSVSDISVSDISVSDASEASSLHSPAISQETPHSPPQDSSASAHERKPSIRSDPFADILEVDEDEPENPPEPKDPAVVLTPRELALQRYGFFAAVLALNIMCIILSYVDHKGSAIFATVLFIKSRDVLSCLVAMAGLTFSGIKRWFVPLPPVDPQFILTLIPAYSESQEQIIKAIFALQNNGVEPHHQVMLVILDGKPRDIKSSMTRVIKTFERPYDTFKWKRITLEITAGFIEDVPVLVIQKKTNAGKKDSLIMANDLFNYPRDNVPLYTKRLRRELWTDILPQLTRDFSTPFTKFDMMFCTDADSKIHEGALLKLANSLVHEPRAIASCGLVLVELEPGYEWSPWNLYQQFQYCYGQYVRRRAEHFWGKVTCLPGCITMIAMRPECGPAMKKYAEPITHHNVIAHQVQYLGTDRRQTYSLLSQDRGLMTLFVPDAVSETVAPQSLTHYLNQRRRWGSNAYFNNYFYCFGERMEPITRLVATLELVRLTLVYWRFSNTIQFLTGVVRTAHDHKFKVISLAPLLSIGQFPFVWFLFCVLKEKPLRDRAHKLALGWCINKGVAPFMSMAVFTKVAMNVGSQVWGISGVTASSAPAPAAVPVVVEVSSEAAVVVELTTEEKANSTPVEPRPMTAGDGESISDASITTDGGSAISFSEPDFARPHGRDRSHTLEGSDTSSIRSSTFSDLQARRRSKAKSLHLSDASELLQLPDLDVAAAQACAQRARASETVASPSSPFSPATTIVGLPSPRSPASRNQWIGSLDAFAGPSLGVRRASNDVSMEASGSGTRSASIALRNASIDTTGTLVEEPTSPRRGSVLLALGKERKASVFDAIKNMTIVEEQDDGKRQSQFVRRASMFREYLAKQPIDDDPTTASGSAEPVQSLNKRRFGVPTEKGELGLDDL